MLDGSSSRRDDVESLLYASLMHGQFGLPWSNVSEILATQMNWAEYDEGALFRDICQAKTDQAFLNHFSNFPVELKLAYRYIKSLGYYDRPDYI